MRGEQLARQWRILRTIESRKNGATVAELAAQEDCHSRTIWRDLAAIQAAGFPLYSERGGHKNRWNFVEGYRFNLPVPFTVTELMSLYFYRDILRIFKDTVFYEALDELFRKIRTTLPPESLSYLRRIEQTFHIGFKPFKDYSRFKEIINQINEAVLKCRGVEMRYYSMSSKRETTRKVDPYKVWFFNGTLYLIGWCHVHNEIRMFVLDRIRLLHVTKERFVPPDGFDLDEYMKDCFGVIHTDAEKVVIRFDASLERYLKENIWHPSQVFKKGEDGSLLMSMEVGGLVEVMSWVLGLEAFAGHSVLFKVKTGEDFTHRNTLVFRGRKSESGAEIEQKGMFCDGLIWEAGIGAGAGASSEGCGTRACGYGGEVFRKACGYISEFKTKNALMNKEIDGRNIVKQFN